MLYTYGNALYGFENMMFFKIARVSKVDSNLHRAVSGLDTYLHGVTLLMVTVYARGSATSLST